MRKVVRFATVVGGGLLLFACATQVFVEFDNDPLLADGPSLGIPWDEDAEVAEITAGVSWEERVALEVSQPYGNSFFVWHFSGLTPDAPVAVSVDIWVDTIFNDTWVELHWAPGLLPATEQGLQAIRTNSANDDGYQFKWDSTGEDRGASSNGWITVGNAEQRADSQGRFTVGIWAGHWSNNPAVVPFYLDTLTVGPAQ